jgi:hypothetical protein
MLIIKECLLLLQKTHLNVVAAALNPQVLPNRLLSILPRELKEPLKSLQILLKLSEPLKPKNVKLTIILFIILASKARLLHRSSLQSLVYLLLRKHALI